MLFHIRMDFQRRTREIKLFQHVTFMVMQITLYYYNIIKKCCTFRENLHLSNLKTK
jgi:hypothetical protein